MAHARIHFKKNISLFPFKADHPVFDIEGAVVVGDDDDTGVLFVGDLGEEFHHLAAAFLIEGGGGCIGGDEAFITR
jgi:hypothetical protein